MNEQKELFDALNKKAKGFTSDEIMEEYSVNSEGELFLSKRKISTKYYPPDTTAIKSIMEISGFDKLSDEELENERLRLLTEFANLNNCEEIDEKKIK